MQYSQQLQQALQPATLQGHQQMDSSQPTNFNQHLPIAQENMQIEPYHSQPAEMEKYNPNIGKLPEIKQYICTLCQTPTRYDTYEKLKHHRKRFHAAFDQTERGTKRKKNIGMMMVMIKS